MTPSPSTPAGRSLARPGTGTRSAPATATPPGAGATSGWSSPCWSASPSPQGRGPCRCWLRLLLRVLLRWFPGRQFVFAGDQGYGSHEMATLAGGSRGRPHLVSKFYPDANLYEPPPEYKGKGR